MKLRPTVAGYYGNYGMSSAGAGGSPSWYSSSSRAASTAQGAGAAWAGATWANSGGEHNVISILTTRLY